MKQSGRNDPAKHLKNAINYILNPEKTQNGYLTGAVNCMTDYALDQMLKTKQRFAKTDNRQGYHLVISFVEGEVTAEQALEITKKFTEQYLGKEYEAVYAVHDNTKHTHGHIVWNSVSFLHGRKYHFEKGDWKRYIQPIVNRLCEEYELSTIDLDAPNNKAKEWDQHKNGTFAFSSMIALDVEDALSFATDVTNFFAIMKLKDYEVKCGKHISVKPKSMKRFRRLSTINSEYTEESISKRISEGKVKKHYRQEKVNPAPKILYTRGSFKRIKRAELSPYQKKYFSKLYKTGQLKKKPYSQACGISAWQYKDDIKNFKDLQEQYLYIRRMNITTSKKLLERQEFLKSKKDEIKAEYRMYYRKRYPYKEILYILKQINSVIEEAMLYKAGELDFKAEYDSYCKSIKELYALGTSLEQAAVIKRELDNELSHIRERSKMLSREQMLLKKISNSSFQIEMHSNKNKIVKSNKPDNFAFKDGSVRNGFEISSPSDSPPAQKDDKKRIFG